MGHNAWAVGEVVPNGVVVYDTAGAKVTSGTVPIYYVAKDSGNNILYLQDDLVTMSVTPNSIDLSYDATEGIEAHAHFLTIPEAMRGLNGFFKVTDPTSGFEHMETWDVAAGAEDGATGLTISDGAP